MKFAGSKERKYQVMPVPPPPLTGEQKNLKDLWKAQIDQIIGTVKLIQVLGNAKQLMLDMVPGVFCNICTSMYIILVEAYLPIVSTSGAR